MARRSSCTRGSRPRPRRPRRAWVAGHVRARSHDWTGYRGAPARGRGRCIDSVTLDAVDARQRGSMAFDFVPSDEVLRIRRRLAHPVIDADGHLVEFMPMVID